MSWNKHEAVSYARSHAHHYSTGYCARAVAAAIRAGGLEINGADAKTSGALWESRIQQQVRHPHWGWCCSHWRIARCASERACMHLWRFGYRYSDFKQNSLYPGQRYRKIQPKITFYRHYWYEKHLTSLLPVFFLCYGRPFWPDWACCKI